MACTGSLQYSHHLGVCKNQTCSKRHVNVTGREHLHLVGANLSSLLLRKDNRSLPVSTRLYVRRYNISRKYNLIKCNLFSNLGQPFNGSSLKDAAVSLTRSCSSVQLNHIVLKLVPAVGLLAFAVWGLGPMVRQGRNIFLHKNDNNWGKSSTYHVTTFYLQPLLLWTGTMLICRALGPMVLPTEASQIVKQRLLVFVKSLATVLAFAYCLSSVIQQAQKFFVETNDPGDARNMGFHFAGRAVYTAVWVASITLFMELLGFPTQKWLTAGGLGTVLLTLAGREIFTNFLSGIMIHATRPFVVNEWIQTKIEGYEVSGTVEKVGWWSPTIIRGEDREALHIPNHKFTVNVVRNLTQKTHWRIKTHIAISHLDVNKINNIVADMRKVLAKNPQVEQKRLHRRIFLDNINPENQALLILVSCFVKTSHFEEYLCVKEAILLDLLRVIKHHRARLATPIRTIQKIYSDSDLDNMGSYADSIFNQEASSRPLLLIEPQYKINGEDRTKNQTRSAQHINGEEDRKPVARPASDNKSDAKGGVTPDSKLKDMASPDFDGKDGPPSDLKADDRSGQLPTAGAGEDSKVTGKPLSDPRISNKPSASVTSRPVSKFESRSAEVSLSESKTDPDTKSVKPANSSSARQSKQEDQKPPGKQPQSPKPALEENIVLGVALEGSKRTLPIEEGLDIESSNSSDVKELTASRAANGLPLTEKNKKDTQHPDITSSLTNDHLGKQE